MATKVTKDELTRLVHEAAARFAQDNPQALMDALAGNADALRATLEAAGFSVTERTAATPEALLEAHRANLQSGVSDGGLGRAVRNRCRYEMTENPFTGRKRRNFLTGELDTLAGAWFRAFSSRNWVDSRTGRSLQDIYQEMEKHVRAPATPMLGEEGENMGAIVPTAIAAQIFEEVNEKFVLRGLVQTFTSGGPLNIPRRHTEITVSRGATATTDIAEDEMELGAVSLAPQRVGVITYFDPRLAAAAVVGPVAYVIGQIAEAIAKDDQRCILMGNPSALEPLGIGELPTTAPAETFERAKVATYDNTDIDTARQSMKRGYYAVKQAHRGSASFVWAGNSDALRNLTEHNSDAHKPWDDATESYLRRRFIETSALVTAGNPAQSTILGGDVSQYAWLEHPLGLRLEQSLVGGKAWESDTIGVKAVQYVDGAPVIPQAFVHIEDVEDFA